MRSPLHSLVCLARPSNRRLHRFSFCHRALSLATVLFCVLLTLFISTPISEAVAPNFTAKQDFATGNNPFSVAMGDLNGDGIPDLAIANNSSASVSVLLNTTAPGAAAPSFAVKQDFTTGSFPKSVAIGDLNRDGLLDLAVANEIGATVSVLLNTTAPGAAIPSFAAKQDFTTGSLSNSVTLGDLNGDGALDLAVANNGSNTVSVLFNTTAPGSALLSFFKQDFAAGGNPIFVALGDLNRDGELDIAVTNAVNTVSVLLNTTAPGATTPSFATKQDFGTGAVPISVAVRDLNGDGAPDLAVANVNDSAISVLLNTSAPGAVTLSFATKQDFATGNSPSSVTVGDLNGDGRVDLGVACFSSNVVSVLINTTAPGAATPSFAAKQDFATGSGSQSVTTGDMNGDGKLDLSVANHGANTVSVLLNATDIGPATPGFTAKQDFAIGAVPEGVKAADLNGDGKLDLAVSNRNATVSVFLNTTAPGAALPSFAAKQDFTTGRSSFSLAVGDFNGDGRPDLAVANVDDDNVSVLLNTTAPGAALPSFAAKQDFTTGDFPQSVAVGDFNGDGRPDLAVGDVTVDSVSVLLNTTAPGAALPSFAAKQDFYAFMRPSSIVVGDMNNDGKPDLAVANNHSGAHDVSVLLNTTAPGAPAPSFAANQRFTVASRPASVAVGDLNGDGKLDLVSANPDSPGFTVRLNTSAPGATMLSFTAQQDFGTVTPPSLIALGDLNGDGKLDLAIANRNFNSVSVLVNTTAPGAALSSFAVKRDFTVGDIPVSVALKDLNGDGKLDLAVVNNTSTDVSVLLNSPSVVAETGLSRQQGLPGANSQIATVTNYGGNGSLIVSVSSANPANGVTISNIVNTNGNVTADIAASCTATNATFTLQATDGVSSTVNTTLNITVTANTPPTLTYASPQSVAFNGSLNVSPTTATDNGSITGYAVQSVVPALTTAPTVNASGVVSITNAQPAGSHVITIRATDNCGLTTDAAFTLNVSKGNQTITVGTHAPASATFNTSFTVAATSSSGLPVSYSSAGVCTNVGATFTMTSGTGTCTVKYDQAGDSNFNNAPQVTESVTAQKANQTLTVGTHAPATAAFNTSFTVAATSDSGLAVAYSSAGVCTNVGATFTMTASTGTCTVRYDQAGNTNFNAAPQVTESVTAQRASTSTALISSLNPSALAQSVTFTATVTSAAGTPQGTVQFKIDGVNSGSPVTLSGSGVGQLTTSSLTAGTHTVTADYSGNTNFAVSTGTLAGGQVVNNRPLISLSASGYDVSESAGFVTITVIRGGDTTTAVSVNYNTSADNGLPCSTANGVATPKCDFTTALGTLNFAAGETSKTITILISQDSFVEGPETFSLTLSNPTGGTGLIGPATASITIADDATEPPTNAIDEVRNFVRQHYHDFLNREPDQSGWDFWTNQITSCGSDVQCNEVRRIDVSASFFLSIEFQQTGYLVERFYKVGYGDGTGISTFGVPHQIQVPMVRANEFLTDTQRIGRGVIVLAPGWEQALENNKQAYALEFVQTARFTAAGAFPTTMTPAQFVDKLNQNAGNVLSPSERTTAINLFGGAANSSNVTARAQAVRQVAEDLDLYNAEFNRAFVLAEYFGYLRRNPNDAPESTLDYTGFDFWLTKLNQFNGNYINAEMVKAFLSSIEYRQRFAP